MNTKYSISGRDSDHRCVFSTVPLNLRRCEVAVRGANFEFSTNLAPLSTSTDWLASVHYGLQLHWLHTPQYQLGFRAQISGEPLMLGCSCNTFPILASHFSWPCHYLNSLANIMLVWLNENVLISWSIYRWPINANTDTHKQHSLWNILVPYSRNNIAH